MSGMRWQIVERGLNIAVAAAVVLVAGAYLLRSSRAQTPPSRAQVPSDSLIPEWQALIADGVVLTGDPTNSDIVILEFIDFECPYCKRFAEGPIRGLAADDVALVLVHMPLAQHRFAKPAAIAFECGTEQGRAKEMHDALFAAADQYGLRPWSDYAVDAGIGDIAKFSECILRPIESFDRIARGLDLAVAVGAPGTPTVIVNGLRLRAAPATVEDIIRAAETADSATLVRPS